MDDDDGQDDDGGGGGKGVLLAVAVLLLWLAGVCFWIALEGVSVLPDALPIDGSGKRSYVLGVVQALTAQAQKLQQAGTSNQQQTTGGG